MTNYPKTTRINARIDHVAEEQLEYIIEHTDMNITDAMKESIHLLYEKVRKEHARPYEILKRLGLIGMGCSGDPSLSENYKEFLTRYLKEKHGYR